MRVGVYIYISGLGRISLSVVNQGSATLAFPPFMRARNGGGLR